MPTSLFRTVFPISWTRTYSVFMAIFLCMSQGLKAQDPYDYRFSISVKGGLDIPLEKSFYQFDNETIFGNKRFSFSPEVGLHYNVSSNFTLGLVFNYFQLGGFQSLDFDEVASKFGLPKSAELADQLFRSGDTLFVINGFNYFQSYIFGLSFYHRIQVDPEEDRASYIWPYIQGHIGFGMVNRQQKLSAVQFNAGNSEPVETRLDVLGEPCLEDERNCPGYDFVLFNGAKQVNAYLGAGYNVRLRNRLDIRVELGFMRFFAGENENGTQLVASNLIRARVGALYHFSQNDHIFTKP